MADARATGHPVARSEGLLVTEAGGDTLVYDLESHRAHSLDAAAAALWRRCDGTRDVAALARSLGDAFADDATREEVARYTLARLGAANLLRETAEVAGRPISRRALLRRAAAAGVATLALPTVLTVVAPTTLQAQASCLPGGSLCAPGGPPCCQPFNCRPVPPGPIQVRRCE